MPGTCPDIQPVAGKPPWPTGPSGTVPTTSVEKILADHPDIHMVKIDIDGSEMELL